MARCGYPPPSGRVGFPRLFVPDYIWREDGGGAQHMNCNPRRVGSISAYLAGLDLVELLLQVSSGKGELRRVQLIEREVVA